ncbi:MAG: hypothetical protein ACOYNC_14380 [Bacteroidales bacterium]
MRISKLSFFCIVVGLLSVAFWSCRKQDKVDNTPGLTLSFSTDTLFFDTVFPTVGSITKRLVVFNKNKNKVTISSIQLSGGQSSSYRINVNGTPATSASEVELSGGDSIYIFVRVTIDPHNDASPYVVSDSLQFVTNGTTQKVNLVSWGREAIFYRDANLSGNIVWDSLRAHVIYGSVRIDTSSSLFIKAGTRIYLHKDAYLAVSFLSTMKIEGTLDHPVRIQGDRMDPFYKDLPGQWGGIYLEKGSQAHEISYAYISNGMFGLAVDSMGSASVPMLSISNSIVQNMASVGIYAYNTSITGINCVIGDCGGSCLSINNGGSYDFRYLTIGNYWYSSVRHASALYVSNYSYDDKGAIINSPLTKASFTNAIIYGTNDDEVELDSVTTAQFDYTFDHAILKTKLKTTNPLKYINCQVNKDPKFVDPAKLNYGIDTLSPAIKMARDIGIPYDIRGVARGAEPALGAYEYFKMN